MTTLGKCRDHGTLGLAVVVVALLAGGSVAWAQAAAGRAAQEKEKPVAPAVAVPAVVTPAVAGPAVVMPAVAGPAVIARVAAAPAVATPAVAPLAPSGQATAIYVSPQDERPAAVAVATWQENRVRPGGFYSWISSWPRGWSRGLVDRVMRNAEELELTAEQEERIRALQRDHRRADIRREADIEIAELELEDLYEDDSVDLDAIEARLRELANLRVEDQMADLRLHRSVREVLTPEQLEGLESMDDSLFRVLRFEDAFSRERFNRERRR